MKVKLWAQLETVPEDESDPQNIIDPVSLGVFDNEDHARDVLAALPGAQPFDPKMNILQHLKELLWELTFREPGTVNHEHAKSKAREFLLEDLT